MTTSQRLARIVLLSVCVLIGAMWVYAFLFASRESINQIGDTAWQERSEQRCIRAREARLALEDNTPMDPTDRDALLKKADIVDKATDALERAIDEMETDIPADEKGRAIVPLWIADYRTYIQDRRLFADALRTAERRPYFAESEVEGVPISERIGKFARENDMRSCQPPKDLSV